MPLTMPTTTPSKSAMADRGDVARRRVGGEQIGRAGGDARHRKVDAARQHHQRLPGAHDRERRGEQEGVRHPERRHRARTARSRCRRRKRAATGSAHRSCARAGIRAPRSLAALQVGSRSRRPSPPARSACPGSPGRSSGRCRGRSGPSGSRSAAAPRSPGRPCRRARREADAADDHGRDAAQRVIGARRAARRCPSSWSAPCRRPRRRGRRTHRRGARATRTSTPLRKAATGSLPAA